MSYHGSAFTLGHLQPCGPETAKLHDAYLDEFDRALAWAKLPTNKATFARNGAQTAPRASQPRRRAGDTRLCKRSLAPWRSGYAAACKAVYTSSILVGASGLTRDLRSADLENAPEQIDRKQDQDDDDQDRDDAHSSPLGRE